MENEVIDLTKMKPVSEGFSKTDLVILVTTGGVGYLAKEAFRHFFPGTPSVSEQLEALARLIEACGRSGAKSLKVRLSVDAKRALHLPNSVKGSKIVAESDSTIDLEVAFA